MRIFVVSLAFLSILAVAANPSATLSWQMATAYVDGSPLAASDIVSTHITYYRKGSTTPAGTLDVAAPATTAQVPLSCGSYDFTAETVITGANSNESPRVTFDTGVVCKPNPPTGLAAQ